MHLDGYETIILSNDKYRSIPEHWDPSSRYEVVNGRNVRMKNTFPFMREMTCMEEIENLQDLVNKIRLGFSVQIVENEIQLIIQL